MVNVIFLSTLSVGRNLVQWRGTVSSILLKEIILKSIHRLETSGHSTFY